MYNFHENIKKMTYQEFLNFVGFNIYYKLSFFNCIPDDVTTIIVHKDENYNEKKQLGVSDIGFAGSIYDVNYPSMDKLIDEAYKILLRECNSVMTYDKYDKYFYLINTKGFHLFKTKQDALNKKISTLNEIFNINKNILEKDLINKF